MVTDACLPSRSSRSIAATVEITLSGSETCGSLMSGGYWLIRYYAPR
jgi:hypothetical protein